MGRLRKSRCFHKNRLCFMSSLLFCVRLTEQSEVFPAYPLGKKDKSIYYTLCTLNANRRRGPVRGERVRTFFIQGGDKRRKKKERRLIKIWSAVRVYILCVMWECSREEMDSRVIYLHIHFTFWSRPLARRHCSIGRFLSGAIRIFVTASCAAIRACLKRRSGTGLLW